MTNGMEDKIVSTPWLKTYLRSRNVIARRQREHNLAVEAIRHRWFAPNSRFFITRPWMRKCTDKQENGQRHNNTAVRFGAKPRRGRTIPIPATDRKGRSPVRSTCSPARLARNCRHHSRTDYAWRYLHRNTILLPLLPFIPCVFSF